jgi:hypothetical protein
MRRLRWRAGILREELAEVHILYLGMMLPQHLPGRPFAERADSSLRSWDRDHVLFRRRINGLFEMNRIFREPCQSWSIPVRFIAADLTPRP